jgi:hypothetical protein
MGTAERGTLKTLEKSIEDLAGKTIAEKVMEGSEQIAREKDRKRIAEWVKSAMERLDSSTPEKTRIQIMERCGRNCAMVHKAILNRAKARRKKYKNEEEFLKAEQNKPAKGTRLLKEAGVLYQIYTPRAFSRPMRCYCSILRELPAGQTVSRTYCHCGKGFVKRFWETALGRPLEVDLIQSAVSGADECKFAIHL